MGAHWLDDPSNLSCKESTRQYAVDDPLLSCKQPIPVRVRAPAPPTALLRAVVLGFARGGHGGGATLLQPGGRGGVHPAALSLDVVDLALAVLLAARLEGEHLRVLREVLDLTQHLSNVIPQG